MRSHAAFLLLGVSSALLSACVSKTEYEELQKQLTLMSRGVRPVRVVLVSWNLRWREKGVGSLNGKRADFVEWTSFPGRNVNGVNPPRNQRPTRFVDSSFEARFNLPNRLDLPRGAQKARTLLSLDSTSGPPLWKRFMFNRRRSFRGRETMS
jgi:hypothetical protein